MDYVLISRALGLFVELHLGDFMRTSQLRRFILVAVSSLSLLTIQQPSCAEPDLSSSVDPTVAGSVLGIGAAIGAGFLLFGHHGGDNNDGDHPQPPPVKKSGGPVVFSSNIGSTAKNQAVEFTNSYLQVTPGLANGVAIGNIFVKNASRGSQTFSIAEKPTQDNSISFDTNTCGKSVPPNGICNIRVSYFAKGYVPLKVHNLIITGSDPSSSKEEFALSTSSAGYNKFSSSTVSTQANSLPNLAVTSLNSYKYNGVPILSVDAFRTTDPVSQSISKGLSLTFNGYPPVQDPKYPDTKYITTSFISMTIEEGVTEYQLNNFIGKCEGGGQDGRYFFERDVVYFKEKYGDDFIYSSKPFSNFKRLYPSDRTEQYYYFFSMYDEQKQRPVIMWDLEFRDMLNRYQAISLPDDAKELRYWGPESIGADGIPEFLLAITEHGLLKFTGEGDIFEVQFFSHEYLHNSDSDTLAAVGNNVIYLVSREGGVKGNQAILVTKSEGQDHWPKFVDIPTGETVTALYLDSHDNTLKIGTQSGKIYQTSIIQALPFLVNISKGLTPGFKINQIMRRDNDKALLAATDAGLFVYNEASKSWVQQSTGLAGSQIVGFAKVSNGNNGVKYYAAANADDQSDRGYGVFESLDGVNWMRANAGIIPQAQFGYPITTFFSDLNTKILLVGLANKGGAYRLSTLANDDQVWDRLEYFDNLDVTAFGDTYLGESSKAYAIFAGADLPATPPVETHVSTDGGVNWVVASSIPGNRINAFSHLTAEHTIFDLFGGSNRGVFWYNPFDGKWYLDGLSGIRVKRISDDGKKTFATTDNDIYFRIETKRSKNSGQDNWKSFNFGGPATAIFESDELSKLVFAGADRQNNLRQGPTFYYSGIETPGWRVVDDDFYLPIGTIAAYPDPTLGQYAHKLVAGTAIDGIYFSYFIPSVSSGKK